MKKLPEIYKNQINKKINNNKNYCYLKEDRHENNAIKNTTIEEKLTFIFNGMGYSYNIPVTITTKDKVYKTSLVTKTKNNLITLDNDVIKINDIISLDLD